MINSTNMQLLLSSVCLALTSAVVGNAYYQKKQFYPAVVYITKSNASMAVIYIQFFVIVFMFGKLLRKIFLGTLRAAEFEHLLERFWYAITETCLAFTVFRDDFNPRFVALFTVLLFLKSFHWLAEERVDFMERSPVLGWLFHIRVASLLAVLGGLDYMLLMHAYSSTLEKGPTVQLVFGFEYAILLTVIASTSIKYVLHTAEMRTDTPWENKAVFLLYTELVIGLIKVVLYIFFVIIMVKIYALPMFIFRPMFFTIRNFKKALSDVIMSRRAIRNMNTLYPDATPEELRLSDNICIICREDMVNHSKKLPCGHIFHTTCLRSWFQRQQTCPTCRLNILRTPTGNSTALAAARGGADAAAAAAAQNNANVANVAGAGVPLPAGVVAAAVGVQLPGAVGLPQHLAALPLLRGNQPPVPNVPDNLATATGSTTTAEATSTANASEGGSSTSSAATLLNFPGSLPPGSLEQVQNNLQILSPSSFMMQTPFPFVAPYTVPPPPMPDDLSHLSIEELKALEGNERKNIEERLKLLRNIDLMLNAAGVLMNNYQMIAPRAPPPVIPTVPTSLSATPTSTLENNQASTSGAGAASSVASTSSAAAASSSQQVTNKNEEPATATSQVVDGNPPVVTSTTTIDKLNTVTVEDLPGDEEEVSSSSSLSSSPSKGIIEGCSSSESTSPTSNSSSVSDHSTDTDDSNELNKLRRKRIKFLEDLNKNNNLPTA